MDLILSHCHAFVAGPTERKNDQLLNAFEKAGAVAYRNDEDPNDKDWYDLPPKPIWAGLLSPDDAGEVSGLSPNLRALGTAKIRLRLANRIKGYLIIAVIASVTLELDLEVPDVDWREELVPEPGRAVLQGRRPGSSLDLSKLAETIACVASTGDGGSGTLSLRAICYRRTESLQRDLKEAKILPPQPVFPKSLGVSVASSSLYIDGSRVYDSAMSIASDLMPHASEATINNVASEATINQASLDFLEEYLRKMFSKLPSGRNTDASDWIAARQIESQFVASGLSSFFEVDNSQLLGIFNARLSVDANLKRCQQQFDLINHSIGWQIILDLSQASRLRLTTAFQYIDDKEKNRSLRFFASVRATWLALGIGFTSIGIFQTLDMAPLGYALTGAVFISLGLIKNVPKWVQPSVSRDSDRLIPTNLSSNGET